MYLEFGKENGGMVKDVSEGGMRFYLINPVAAGQSLYFSVNLDANRRVEGQALMVWTDAGGKSGGMSFSELSAESRETLRAWLAEIDSPLTATPDAPVHVAPPNKAPSPEVPVPAVPAPVAPVPPAPHTAATTPVTPRVAAPSRVAPALIEAAPATPAPAANAPVAPLTFTPAPAVPPPIAPTPAAPEPVTPRAPSRTTAELLVEVTAQARVKSPPEIPAESPDSDASRPVTREDWIRAARENLVPGDRSGRLTVSSITEPPAGPSMMERLLPVTSAAPIGVRTAETKKVEEVLERVDPLREFLRHRIDNSEFAHTLAETNTLTEEHDATPNEPVRNGWPLSRVAMILALAAICGAAAAFAAIAYRQSVGESIIKLGEEISGEPRPSGTGDVNQPTAAPSGEGDPQTAKPDPGAAMPANKRPATTQPAATKPANPATSPITQARPQTLQQSPNPQTELAAGREVVPGTPKHLPEDVAALWVAVENGDANAEVRLANRYVAGDGVGKNCDQARVLLQAAAKRGNELATKRLTELSQAGCQ